MKRFLFSLYMVVFNATVTLVGALVLLSVFDRLVYETRFPGHTYARFFFPAACNPYMGHDYHMALQSFLMYLVVALAIAGAVVFACNVAIRGRFAKRRADDSPQRSSSDNAAQRPRNGHRLMKRLLLALLLTVFNVTITLFGTLVLTALLEWWPMKLPYSIRRFVSLVLNLTCNGDIDSIEGLLDTLFLLHLIVSLVFTSAAVIVCNIAIRRRLAKRRAGG